MFQPFGSSGKFLIMVLTSNQCLWRLLAHQRNIKQNYQPRYRNYYFKESWLPICSCECCKFLCKGCPRQGTPLLEIQESSIHENVRKSELKYGSGYPGGKLKFISISIKSFVLFTFFFCNCTFLCSDPTTKRFPTENIDPVFGFPQLVRFSWSTSDQILKTKGVAVEWEDTAE